MLLILSEFYKMGDNIRPQDQLAAVQGDFGSVPELFNQQPVDIDRSAEKEKHRLIHQIALSNLSQQVLGGITPKGKQLLNTAQSLLQTDSENQGEYSLQVVELLEQLKQVFQDRADKVLLIQDQRSRMDAVKKVLQETRPPNSSGDQTAYHMMLWDHFGSRLMPDDPCRHTVWSSLPKTVRSQISEDPTSWSLSSRSTDYQ